MEMIYSVCIIPYILDLPLMTEYFEFELMSGLILCVSLIINYILPNVATSKIKIPFCYFFS